MNAITSRIMTPILILILIVVAGCNGAAEVTLVPMPSTTSARSAVLSSTTTTAVDWSTTATSVFSDPTDDVADAWEAFWSAWTEVRASEDLDPSPLEAVATQNVVDDVIALLERQAETTGPSTTEITTSPVVYGESVSAATIGDCVLMSPSIAENTGVWYEAELEDSGTGWVVASLRINETSGCVPSGMAAEAIASYMSYYDAEAEFWNPADPSSSFIDQVLAEPQRGFVVGLLETNSALGVGFRNDAVHHPEVVEVRSGSELVILDCYEPGADYGLYDLESDERLPDELEVRPGQRNLRSAVMVFEDGRWKVADLQGQVDFVCEFAPTDRGLPSV